MTTPKKTKKERFTWAPCLGRFTAYQLALLFWPKTKKRVVVVMVVVMGDGSRW